MNRKIPTLYRSIDVCGPPEVRGSVRVFLYLGHGGWLFGVYVVAYPTVGLGGMSQAPPEKFFVDGTKGSTGWPTLELALESALLETARMLTSLGDEYAHVRESVKEVREYMYRLLEEGRHHIWAIDMQDSGIPAILVL